MKQLSERFWSKVAKHGPDECWLWTAHKTHRGYGHMYGLGKNISGHRASWEIHNGPVPVGLCVLHRCDVRACVNPAHLFLGTVADNNADMIAKGRLRSAPIGEINPNAKLSASDVVRIRATHGPRHRIAEQYGISATSVRDIKTRATWGHIP